MEIRNKIQTGVTEKLQPWQALFGLLTYVVTQFDVSDDKVLILCAFLAATLGFTQVMNYKHKEAVKEVVAPWLLERLLKILGEYLPTLPEPPSETPVLEVPKQKELQGRIEALEAELEAEVKDGTSDSG